MKFERVKIRNFKCYDAEDVRLDRGVTVVYGLNGSGKSSLLEACFFALYGTDAVPGTANEVVTTGTEEMAVTLWFTHDGDEYELSRELKLRDGRVGRHDCVLTTPAGSIEGVTDVEAHIVELLRMDASAFVNCAYVRQGEVNKLINASPSERQDMIDDLLQLGKLEDYRERAGDARLGVEDVLTEYRSRLDQRAEDVNELENQALHERRNALQSDLAEVESEIERFEENQQNARETKEEAERVLSEYEEKREELDSVRETIADLREDISDTENERDSLQETLREHRERASDLDDRVESLLADTDLDGDAGLDAVEARREELDAERETVQSDVQEVANEMTSDRKDAESFEERADDLAERAAEARERADDLEAAAADAAEEVAELDSTIADIESDIEESREAFADAPVAFGEATEYRERLESEREELRAERTDVREELASARSRVEDAEELLAEGKCPECGQPVEGSPHVASIEEYRERVGDLEADLDGIESDIEDVTDRIERASELEAVERTVADLESRRESKAEVREAKAETVAEKRDDAAAARERADDLESRAEGKREDAAAARERVEERRERLGDLQTEKQSLDERIERLGDLAEALRERERERDAAERVAEKRESLGERNEERRERLAELRERKRSLESAYDEERIETAEANKREAEQYLEQVAGKLDSLRERRDEIQGELGGVKKDIETLERLREERDALEETVEELQDVHGETEALESLYGDLRAELRQRNVDRLERLLNETFDLVYQNDSYARIELDGTYELTVYQKDGERLDPEQLSGGERALFNLSLRCAIYRLLSEGIEGSAPMPPLILDEPTVFLDSGHVSQLVELVESMREVGVEQILVVSHDESLLGAADDLVRVQKDATTNRSHVEHDTPTLNAE
ncbi:DNA double-strand break repair ATPase Rad50 [Salarchaeum sp. JOR-1]|uniref:DNA double-strand break repair ATPase Rad50 n=1 Tax=Salarchaeum sp. JOR-1 TaxID=2599399 RepID=UPI001198B9D9|nr:DNA double-strand break repair ATPase Rad50 [Salarchaeum sp. JOR-1]QDX41489.1 DNA double-strand break repair Rad50 ATPase [Salarchaeum sp. JOR-1]